MMDAARPNPFPGLRAFDATEAHLFFGREGQSDEVLRRLRLHRFVAVVGSSGSGKSSLVRAGLLPALQSGLMVAAGSEWRIATMRPGADPIGRLAHALGAPDVLGRGTGDEADAPEADFGETVLRRGALGLIERVAEARLPSNQNVLVVVDQFEELFRLRQTAEASPAGANDAAAFVKLLLEATRQRALPIYVVITMRSDYLGDCAQFRDLPEAINEGQYLIPRLTRDERRQAIVCPVAVSGAAIAPRLVNRLLNEAGDNPDQLPILQHALMRTWDHWARRSTGSEPIDLADYEAIGGMREALSRHADEAFAELPDARARTIAEKIFRRLTEKGADNREIRRPSAVAELGAIAEASEADTVAVVEVFRRAGRSFLMPPPPAPLRAGSVVDISHESLIRGWGRLRSWVDEEAESAKMYRRLADTARLHAMGRAGLWRDPELRLATDWWERDRPNEAWAKPYDPDFAAGAAFLAQSRAAHDTALAAAARQRRRRRALASGAITVLSVLLAASTYEWYRARQQEVEANRQRLTASRLREIADSVKAGLAIKQDSLADANRRLEDEATNLRHEALHVRKAERENNTNLIALVTRMLPDASPLGATFLHHAKAVAYANSGQPDSAALEETRALAPDSEYLAPRIDRSDDYLNSGKPRLAVADAEFVLRRNPHSALANLNRAVGLAMLQRYDDALAAFDRAIAGMRYTVDGGAQNHLSPDIQRAALLRSINLSGLEMRTAFYYGRANVLAFAGRDGFSQALARADSERPRSSEILLNALNWSWMQRSVTPKDYGGYAVEGALWERAGFPGEAVRAYDAFRRQDATARDARYGGLRHFVADRWHALNPGDQPPPPIIATPPDVETLVLESQEADDRGAYAQAETALTSALAIDPRDVELLIRRAGVRLERAHADRAARARYYDLVIADCDAALALAPNLSPAYAYRARVNYERSGSDSALRANPAAQRAILADLDRALQSDSANQMALVNRAWAVLPTDTAAGIAALRRATQTLLPAQSDLYYHIARLENALGRHDQALSAADRAIEIKSDSDWYYFARGMAERGLHHPEPELMRRFAEGMMTVGNARRRRNDSTAADSAYAQAARTQLARIAALVPDTRGPDSVRARHAVTDAAAAMTAAALAWWQSADSVRAWYGRLAADPKVPAGSRDDVRKRVDEILADEIRYLQSGRQ